MVSTLQKVRESRGVTKAAMCEALSCTYPTYKKLEDNPELLTMGQMRIICAFLHCEVRDIFLP